MEMKRIHYDSGESLVEVMVGAVILLMMMAVLQGALSFCTNAQQRVEQIRRINEEICQNLRTTSSVPGPENTEYLFRATTADGETPGPDSATLFRVSVELRTKEVSYQDEDGTIKTTTFYLFGSSDEEDEGEPPDARYTGKDGVADDCAGCWGGDTPCGGCKG